MLVKWKYSVLLSITIPFTSTGEPSRNKETKPGNTIREGGGKEHQAWQLRHKGQLQYLHMV